MSASFHPHSLAPENASFDAQATDLLARCLAISDFAGAFVSLLQGADPAALVSQSRNAPPISPLHIAAGRLRFAGNEENLRFNQQALALMTGLIARGAPVNDLCPSLRSPLSHAAISNLSDRALLLLQAGANPNHADIEGLRPLDYAAISDNAELALHLLTAGADASLCFQLEPSSMYFPLIQRSSVPGLCEAWRESRSLESAIHANPSPRRPRPL